MPRAHDDAAVDAVKRRACFVAFPDFAAEETLNHETAARCERLCLPDGRALRLRGEPAAAAEALFDPARLGDEAPGAARLAHDAICGAPIDARRALHARVVLAGGGAALPGFAARLERELRALYRDRVGGGDAARAAALRLRVDDPPRRRRAAFVGAAALADAMRGVDAFWVQQSEWEEAGPAQCLAKLGGGGA